MYISVKQASEKWGISDRRVRILCSEGRIPGVIREGRSWKIPAEAGKPEDGRYKSAENLLDSIDRKKTELDSKRPLTEGEVERLTEEFVVEYRRITIFDCRTVNAGAMRAARPTGCYMVHHSASNSSKPNIS